MEMKLVVVLTTLALCGVTIDAACTTTDAATKLLAAIQKCATGGTAPTLTGKDGCTSFKTYVSCFETEVGDCKTVGTVATTLDGYNTVVNQYCSGCMVAAQISVILACLLGAFMKNINY